MKRNEDPKEETRLKTIRVQIPVKLYEQMDNLVKLGWFRSQEFIIEDAIRRFLNTHRPELLEKFIRDDVEKALRGKS